MPAYIAAARRAFLLATIALVAACSSSSDGTAPVEAPDDTPPVEQPHDSIPTPTPAVARIELSGDREVVHSYMGWLQAKPVDAAGQPIEATVAWQSSDTTIVTVDAGGAMVGRKPGRAIVSAQASGKRAEIEVVVVARRVTSFAPMQALPTLERGDVLWFVTTPLDQHGQRMQDAAITYTSADPALVEVTAGGQLIARHGGRVRVTATADGVSTSQVVTVAEQTTYAIKYANGNRLPWLLMEESMQEGEFTVTSRLVMVEASFTLSNVNDAWSQRTVVEEYRIADFQGNTTTTKVATHVSQSSGFLTIDPSTMRMYLTSGEDGRKLEAWFDGGDVRKLRVYGQPTSNENPFLNDYQR